jgi:Uma2 family endonuclease
MSVVRHRFTVDEYHKMGEAGIFDEDDRVELIDGEVVEMTPIGWRHAQCVTRLNTLLTRVAMRDAQDASGSGYEVSPQNPISLSEHGEPQPDLALLEGLPAGRLPGPAEISLVIEVADTSLAYDREQKLPLYAEAGIPEAWIVDLSEDRIEVYSEPAPGGAGYGKVSRLSRGEDLVSPTVPGLSFGVAEVLPPERS